MGDLQVFSRQLNDVVTDDRPVPVSFSPSLRLSSPDPLSIREDSWVIAEKATKEVICCIHPTLDSDEKRKDVTEYLQRLIRCSLGCEVFPYGSVPLKTYLPDGDIDMTAVISPTIEETLAHDVLAVLQGEEQNENAEYEVKDTQFIDAEVKLVKCLVQNIVIDISFNQLGGLCTLCFLEQVDRVVGKDHLFKRSIILIKAWCYYESRILGANHGLISTYALETLVLYIFHLFHTSLNGPLVVLYTFLDYFSKFDWENYCISLKGPVRKSSLPDIVVDMPANVGDNLMLSEEFFRNCMDMFSIPSRVFETDLRAFPRKHLNIIDPLKENNNLGRSVQRGNFYRIRSAFKYGAHKLGQILHLPRERIEVEIKRFFANTLERHGHNSGNLSSLSHSRTFSEEKIQMNSVNLDLDYNISMVGDNELDRYLSEGDSMHMVSETTCSIDGIGVSGFLLAGEESSSIANETSNCLPSSCDSIDSFSGFSNGARHFHSSGSFAKNGKLKSGMLSEVNPTDVGGTMGFDPSIEHRENHFGHDNAVCLCTNLNHEAVTYSCSGISSPDAAISERLAPDLRERDLADIAVSPETLNPFSDLSGDYDSHIRSLLYGQCCHGYTLFVPVLPNPPTFPSWTQNKRRWDTVRESMPLKQNSCCQMNTNGVVSKLTANHVSNPKPLNSSLASEEKHKPKGTGSYFLNPNGCSCRERSPQGKGRNRATGIHHHFQRYTRINGSASPLPEKKSFEEGNPELPHIQFPVPRHEKSGSSCQSTISPTNDSNAAAFPISSQKLEFGSRAHLTESSELASNVFCGRGSTSSLPDLEVQSSKTILGNNQER